MALQTILGAGGAVSNELLPLLLARGDTVRLVSRSGRPVSGAESILADLTDRDSVKKAVKGSSAVYLLVGLKYDSDVWRDQWPKIMTNVIEACKEESGKLLFFDNVYMYGRVQGAMTEETPFRPVSRKGEVRAKIAEQLLSEMSAGKIRALIARSADFYGPSGDKTSVANLLVFANLAKGKKAQWICNADVVHSFTYIPDAAAALATLSESETAFGQTWHLPTAPNPLTGREFVSAAAAAMNGPNGVFVLPNWMMSLVGLFKHDVKESVEMSYQSQEAYLFDSSKFNTTFGFRPTSYEDGIQRCAARYLKK